MASLRSAVFTASVARLAHHRTPLLVFVYNFTLICFLPDRLHSQFGISRRALKFQRL